MVKSFSHVTLHIKHNTVTKIKPNSSEVKASQKLVSFQNESYKTASDGPARQI